MSRWTADCNELTVESASETCIDMTVQKPAKIANDEKSRPSLERGQWPLIDYDQPEVKSAQELLFEAAWEKNPEKYKTKWDAFDKKIKTDRISSKKLKKMISTLDDERQWTALHYAVECNNRELCRTLIEEPYQCDVNILGGNGENVLHVASRSDLIKWNGPDFKEPPKLIKILIDELGADVNHADDEGRTPLHLAVMRGRFDYACYLIDCGAKVDVLSKLNASVLHFTFFPGNTTNPTELDFMVKYIMKNQSAQEKDLINLCMLDNRTPLVFLACHPALQSGPSVNQTQQQQESPSPKENVVEKLMTLFSDRTRDENQILATFDMIARRHQLQKFDHLQCLVQRCSLRIQIQILHLVCRHDNVAFLRWLICQKELKEHLEAPDYAGYTPLLTATFYNSENCVKELIKVINDDQQTLLIKAGAVGQENILHICAQRRVSSTLFNMIVNKLSSNNKAKLIREPDSDGNLPLHLAARTNKDESHICEGLIKEMKQIKRSDNSSSSVEHDSYILDILSTKNRLGKTAAHEASEQGHVQILQQMWEALSPVNQKIRTKGLYTTDNNRFTCLHLAAMNSNDKKNKVLEYLIKPVGMEVDAIGDRRLTPLHLACEYGNLDVVKYLIDNGASTTLRNAQLFNCLEISIRQQHQNVVKYLLDLPNWRQMMRNAQPIPNTDAYDTPMRKLIRYMPDVAFWMVEEKLTRRVGGEGQKVSKEIYDYEFYEDTQTVKQWYAQGAKLPPEDTSCKARCNKLGVNAIFGCCCSSSCCKSTVVDENLNEETNDRACEPYTRDAYTFVRNHPLLIVSQQSNYPKLMQHGFHILLRKKMFRKFSTYWLSFSFLSYIILLGLWTAVILNGKHPEYFYNLAGFNMTLDIGTCEQVANSLISKNITEVLKTDEYRRLAFALNAFFIVFLVKNGIMVIALFPKVFRTGAYYLEASALVLSFVYILDWYNWQNLIVFRCPIQYQIGAMGLFLAWMNLLTYVRCIPWLNIGIYVAMLQVISFKFLRFFPVLMIIICGFGFTYWMLLQNQAVFGTPIEALIRTSLMMFDLGYESRLYSAPDQVAYYKLVYVIMIFSAIVLCIFIINLMIGLAVGEIPSLMDQGTLWRDQMLYNFLSDAEILRLQFRRFANFLSCYKANRISWMRGRPIHFLTFDERAHGCCERAWHYTNKHFFEEQIQNSVVPKTSSKEDVCKCCQDGETEK